MRQKAPTKKRSSEEHAADEPRDVPHALIKLIEDEGLQVGDRLPPELELVRRIRREAQTGKSGVAES